jgi:hypothetical protein
MRTAAGGIALLLARIATAALVTTDGRLATLSGDGPAVVFYEDRASTGINAHVKAALADHADDDTLRRAVRVVPVANIARYDFPPAREIALAFLRRLERRVHVPILVDLDGTLTAPPWKLPDDTSSVVVLDAGGTPVWRRSGRLSDADVDALFATLAALLHRGPPR